MTATAKRQRGPRDYLFTQPNGIFWFKFQRPGCRVERSTHTTNRAEAELNADYRAEHAIHQAWLSERAKARTPRLVESWVRDFEPGPLVLPAGTLLPNGATLAADTPALATKTEILNALT